MEKITYPSNTVRQHIRNALSSKLFCAVAIVSAIFSASLALNLVTSMLYAGLTQRYEFSGKFVFPILAIIGTVGLFHRTLSCKIKRFCTPDFGNQNVKMLHCHQGDLRDPVLILYRSRRL